MDTGPEDEVQIDDHEPISIFMRQRSTPEDPTLSADCSGRVRAVLDIMSWPAGAEAFAPRPFWVLYPCSNFFLTALDA